jgi:hypothetical protein
MEDGVCAGWSKRKLRIYFLEEKKRNICGRPQALDKICPAARIASHHIVDD